MKITVLKVGKGNSITIPDRYNPNKSWRISVSKSNHYFLEEFIDGRRWGKKQRLGKKYIFEMLFH